MYHFGVMPRWHIPVYRSELILPTCCPVTTTGSIITLSLHEAKEEERSTNQEPINIFFVQSQTGSPALSPVSGRRKTRCTLPVLWLRLGIYEHHQTAWQIVVISLLKAWHCNQHYHFPPMSSLWRIRRRRFTIMMMMMMKITIRRMVPPTTFLPIPVPPVHTTTTA